MDLHNDQDRGVSDPISQLALGGHRRKPQRQFLADFSLALINRTGAYHVSRDLLTQLPEFFAATRYWRIILSRQPRGRVRWLLGKLMIWDLVRLSAGQSGFPQRVPAKPVRPTLFLDPLYVLRAGVCSEDIVLCHDLGPLTHHTLYHEATTRMYQKAYGQIAQARPNMVFVSEASRRVFVSRFGNDFPRLTVIPLYVRRGIEDGMATPPPGIRKPYLLTVGALEIRKNHLRSIAAFGRSGLAERGYSYVICGPRGNSADAIEKLAMATSGVQSLGYRTDEEVRWLYRNACGFVLPSLLEGFGMPGLEAARNGLVSIVSAGTAQEEAVAGAAVLVDPLSETSISAGMRELVDMPQPQRQAIVQGALKRAQELNLDNFVNQWSALLQQV
jgi:glycosyltransferase involved in cell wall biosynthesis